MANDNNVGVAVSLAEASRCLPPPGPSPIGQHHPISSTSFPQRSNEKSNPRSGAWFGQATPRLLIHQAAFRAYTPKHAYG